MNRELLSRLGNPQAGQNFIHVAGTNGKGSVSASLAGILKCAGFKTGLYTSPHLARYNERFKVNGLDITDEDFKRLKAVVDEASQGLKTVEFDRLTAMGFLYFKEQKCDLVVLEVGLGGRLDATNAIENPLVSVIAEIGLEHTEILGDSIEKIAFEKAGIIKKGRPSVFMYQDNGALDVFIKKASEMQSDYVITEPSRARLCGISLESQIINYKDRKGVFLSLLGSYQFKNALLVLDTVDILKAQSLDIPEDAVREGLRTVKWPGRFEVLRKSPLVILDGAHNEDASKRLAESLDEYFGEEKLEAVMGIFKDKDYQTVIKNLASHLKKVYTIDLPDKKRNLGKEKLAEEFANVNIEAEPVKSLKEAIDKAEGNVLITGSLSYLGEARRCIAERKKKLDKEKIMKVAEIACAPTDTAVNMPFEINPKMVMNAIYAADALGRKALGK